MIIGTHRPAPTDSVAQTEGIVQNGSIAVAVRRRRIMAGTGDGAYSTEVLAT